MIDKKNERKIKAEEKVCLGEKKRRRKAFEVFHQTIWGQNIFLVYTFIYLFFMRMILFY